VNLELAGKVIVVTGGSRGIGRATCLSLAAEGATVVTCARHRDGLDALLRELPAGPHHGVVADVTTAAGREALLAATLAAGTPYGLVNNVGGSGAQTWEAADEADFRAVLERNFFTPLLLARALSAHLPAGGAIVNVSSVYGREAGGGPSYNVAKAAVISMTKAMAREVAARGLRVNSVAPGSLRFPGSGWDRRHQADPGKIDAFIARDFPFGRMGRPDEVADTIVFLLSARASWIAGSCIPVDGAQGKAF
jgi:3-oxoacyl-[acyl-carrier protein] reductase